ncbi:hypothetical protein MIND_01418700 [Mycena indigotica]|uniref:Uncharacterized protein n=1 Tax=Mycena indigotica TaxID=2126181 RepID=A0A8H6VNY0_9AGAR|nr:uncharacterized protein MIND_01418700 [Mycena indigotica]KAF7288737.1 hypothetical protein MIND_01418700 [Mycena indigotica]
MKGSTLALPCSNSKAAHNDNREAPSGHDTGLQSWDGSQGKTEHGISVVLALAYAYRLSSPWLDFSVANRECLGPVVLTGHAPNIAYCREKRAGVVGASFNHPSSTHSPNTQVIPAINGIYTPR